MTMISFAQNGEDVMLMRALHDVERGFYIDAGAWEPTQDSVTRAFYDRGWHGINIEPSPEHHAMLQRERPRDINLSVFLDETPGERTFTLVGSTGLSTDEAELAATHARAGFALRNVPVRADTLANVCRAYAPADIHFLKVDVEGAERRALAGMDFTAHRPWIVLVEATVPNSPEPSHADWEPILLGAGYRFAWFDGLNRFYVAAERAEALLPHFQVQPNVFDDFRRHDPSSTAVERDAPVARPDTDAEPSGEAAERLRQERDALAARLRLLEAATPLGWWWRWMAPWWGLG